MDPSLISSPNIVHTGAVQHSGTKIIDSAFEALEPVFSDARAISVKLLEETDPFIAEVDVAHSLAPLYCLHDGGRLIGSAILTTLRGRDGDTAAAGLLQAIGAATHGYFSVYAMAEATRLADRGIPGPAWTRDLFQPIWWTGAWLLTPPPGSDESLWSQLVLAFRRAGKEHAFIVYFNRGGNGPVELVEAFDHERWPHYRQGLLAGEVLEHPYTIEELSFRSALARFDSARKTLWAAVRQDPHHFAFKADYPFVPGLVTLLEVHLTMAAKVSRSKPVFFPRWTWTRW